MTDWIRPGPPSANALIPKHAHQPNSFKLLKADFFWRGRITHRDLTAAATSQALTLSTLFASARTTDGYTVAANPIQTSVRAGDFFIDLLEPFSGGGATSANIIIGRSGDTDAYLSGPASIFTGAALGYLATVAAAEHSQRVFTGRTAVETFAPIVTIASDVNVANLTAGALDVYFIGSLLPTSRPL